MDEFPRFIPKEEINDLKNYLQSQITALQNTLVQVSAQVDFLLTQG